ncbi:MAG: hypothetical protein KJ072_04880 [Verrucomicrobia bacterium]|nr:hypothetical protein [Verrucomicrobiota bacterium]
MRFSLWLLQRFVMGGVWLPLTVLAVPRLDPAFGAGGVATAGFSEPFWSLSEAHATGVLPDGRILLEVNGAPGYVYSVWQTDDPESADWRRVEDAIIEVLNHTVRVWLPVASGPSDYCRVRADQVSSVD